MLPNNRDGILQRSTDCRIDDAWSFTGPVHTTNCEIQHDLTHDTLRSSLTMAHAKSQHICRFIPQEIHGRTQAYRGHQRRLSLLATIAPFLGLVPLVIQNGGSGLVPTRGRGDAATGRWLHPLLSVCELPSYCVSGYPAASKLHWVPGWAERIRIPSIRPQIADTKARKPNEIRDMSSCATAFPVNPR